MPGFRYPAFISYRHGQTETKRRFIEEFDQALTGELEMLGRGQPFIDRNRLNGGDFYNAVFARALYESATLVVVYHPGYFDVQHPYCAREYRAMCALETERLALLPAAEERHHGLIIPLVLRGEGDLPPELVAHRQYEDFSKFMLMDRRLARHPLYAPKIRGIANYINARCRSLDGAGVPFDGADMFQLPGEDDTRQWVRRLNLSGIGFPHGGRA